MPPTPTQPADASTSNGFESPDGRVWERDVDHHDGPLTHFLRRDFSQAFGQGLTKAFDRLGAPLAGAEGCLVNGWFYMRMIPAGAPDKPGASKTPPDLVLKVLSRLHPELRRRDRTARRVVENESWMDDVAAWWDERPGRERRFRARQEKRLDALDDGALADEIGAAYDEAIGMLVRHFELVTPGAGVGYALTTAAGHGIAPIAAAEALRGCSHATAAPVRALAEIRASVDSGTLATSGTLDDLRAASPVVSEKIDAYLGTFGWRVLSDDVAATTLAETPDVLLRALRNVEVEPRSPSPDPIAEVTASVPADDRAEVERLLRNAGKAYEMLDDNSGFVCWGMGLLRRIALEGADRLVAAGMLDRRDDVWMLEAGELADLLRGGHGPTTSEIADRRSEFEASAAADAPEVLGGEAGAPPDPAVFPQGLRTMTEAVSTYLSLRFPPSAERAETGRVEVAGATIATGHGIGSGSATGRAVVAKTADEAMDRLEPGDILVCPVTNPAYNALFPIAGAVVTAVGGVLGHTAVTAREVGIPAVVGIGDLDAITDGTEITVVGG